jgi:hypothetical protein
MKLLPRNRAIAYRWFPSRPHPSFRRDLSFSSPELRFRVFLFIEHLGDEFCYPGQNRIARDNPARFRRARRFSSNRKAHSIRESQRRDGCNPTH